MSVNFPIRFKSALSAQSGCKYKTLFQIPQSLDGFFSKKNSGPEKPGDWMNSPKTYPVLGVQIYELFFLFLKIFHDFFLKKFLSSNN